MTEHTSVFSTSFVVQLLQMLHLKSKVVGKFSVALLSVVIFLGFYLLILFIFFETTLSTGSWMHN